MANKQILLVDDDPSLLRILAHQLQQAGYDVTTALGVAEAQAQLEAHPYDAVITDMSMPDGTGLDLLRRVREPMGETVVIIITAYGTVENAIDACKQGADDYVMKPFSREQLLFALEKALRTRGLEKENIELRAELLYKYDFSAITAKSQPMQALLKMVGKVALTDSTVLILGESGTGKELVARAIHFNSNRKKAPLVTVNCPSIPESLLESELFGHVKGAFTGATRDRKGKFEIAEGGTIFLDEIGDLKPELQAKLLRVLQNREVERVGGERAINVDVRIVAATNRDLEALVQQGVFREDLYYRLTVFPIRLPALRHRKADIPALANHFLQKIAPERTLRFTPEVMEILMAYDWPGNVRELENVIERAIILVDGSLITANALPAHVRSPEDAKTSPPGTPPLDAQFSLMQIEKNAIVAALRDNRGNQTAAAKQLGIPRHVLLYRLKKFGLSSFL